MNILPILNYLNHYELSELTAYSGVKVKDYGDFVVLNYDQIETKKTDIRWHDARGLIVRKQVKGQYSNADILCRPFTRFFNFGETFDSNEFPFERAIAYDKIDGSLMSAWFNPFAKRWEVATRQMAFGEGTTSFGNTYRQLFLDGGFDGEEDFFQHTMFMLDQAMPGYTWIFEMTSPETRVVTPHTEKNIWFLAARNNLSGQYMMASAIRELLEDLIPNMKFPKEYHFNSAKDCELAAKDLPAMEEGYVVYDPITQNRVKLKNPAYVAIHRLKNNDSITGKNITQLVFENEYSEFLSYFPEFTEHVMKYVKAYEELLEEIDEVWNAHKNIPVQKDFALKVLKSKVYGIMFQLRKGLSLTEVLENMNINQKTELLERYFV